MRIFSILTAVIVVIALYFLVLDRERLLSFAGRTDVTEAAATAPDADEPDALGNAGDRVSVVALRSASQVIDSAVVVRGRTEAARQVDVRAETSGLVISEPLRKGAAVAAGDVLCRLDAGTRQAARAEAQGRLAEARARDADAQVKLRAASRLSEDGFASETRLTTARAAAEAARAGIQSAEAAVAAAEKELERLEIRAPFSGLLESDAAELGSLLQPGGVCATVIQLDTIKLVGFVPEAAVEQVEVGARAGGRLATGREVMGRVAFLSRSADMTTRTFRVEVEIDNSDLAIRDGQTVEIFIAAEGQPAHLLPQSALTLNDEGRMGVRVVDAETKAAFRPVSIIRDTQEGIWVTGLDDMAEVIVVGQEFVTDGVPVDVTMRETAQ